MGCRFSKNPFISSQQRRRRQQHHRGQHNRSSTPSVAALSRRRNFFLFIKRLRRNIPVIIITIFLTYSFYAFGIELCLLPALSPNFAGTGASEPISLINFRWILFALYCALLIMFAWSYYAVVYAEHAPIPEKFHITDDDIKWAQNSLPHVVKKENDDWLLLAAQLKARRSFQHNNNKKNSCLLYEREAHEDVNGLVYRTFRLCTLCRALKPDRAHHCRKCQRCILRFDHHCPYTNNCVGYSNYKAYILAIVYGFALTLYTTAVCAIQVIVWIVRFNDTPTAAATTTFSCNEWRALGAWLVLLCITVPSCGLIWLLLFLHCGLATLNRTNIEHQVSPEMQDCQLASPYRLHSAMRNWREVFGTGSDGSTSDVENDVWSWMVFWFFPVHLSSSDGTVYPKRIAMTSVRAAEANIFDWLNYYNAPAEEEERPSVQPATASSSTTTVVVGGGKTEAAQQSTTRQSSPSSQTSVIRSSLAATVAAAATTPVVTTVVTTKISSKTLATAVLPLRAAAPPQQIPSSSATESGGEV